MDDLARGERIKALREQRRLTQPAVVELLDEMAGSRVVTLRGYQAWEAGGGIRWDNAKLLAQVLGVEAEHLMSGGVDEAANGSQLDRIESSLTDLHAKVDLILTALDLTRPDAEEAAADLAQIFRDGAVRAHAQREEQARAVAPRASQRRVAS